jgi:hypothetical protein
MDPIITFPDPRQAVQTLLRELLADREEPEVDGVTVSTKDLPGSDNDYPLPYVQIHSDGKFRDARLDGRATVRVVVWHRDEGLAEALATLCEALLLASSSTEVRGSSSISGPLPTGDPDNGLPMSYFTVTVRLKPRQH